MTFDQKREELARALMEAGDAQFIINSMKKTLTELHDKLNNYNQKIEKLKRECFELQAKEAKGVGKSEEASQDVPSTAPTA